MIRKREGSIKAAVLAQQKQPKQRRKTAGYRGLDSRMSPQLVDIMYLEEEGIIEAYKAKLPLHDIASVLQKRYYDQMEKEPVYLGKTGEFKLPVMKTRHLQRFLNLKGFSDVSSVVRTVKRPTTSERDTYKSILIKNQLEILKKVARKVSVDKLSEEYKVPKYYIKKLITGDL